MAAANYGACLKEILKHEGGYVNDPRDPGGETNYGITVAVARAFGYDGPMKTIPMSLVEKIYRESYWNTPYYKCDALASGVDLAVFDFGINSGPARAVKGLKASIGGDSADTIARICEYRMKFLQGLRTWPTFGRGWTRRVDNVRAVSLKLAGGAAPPPPPDIPKPIEHPKPTWLALILDLLLRIFKWKK